MFPLIFEDVSYTPKDSSQRLINQIQLRIEQPGTLAILGPNGAGKSLFLRLSHQLIKPTSGRVIWQSTHSESAPFRQQSMVFQQPVLLKRSTYDNLKYALKLKPIETKQPIKNLIFDALEGVGLTGKANQQANTLSLGEQQKLAICRALITRPKVLFLDEPTASLDPSATHQIEVILSDVAKSDTKLILTTHDLMQAKRIADDVLFIHHGEIIEHTDIKTFFNNPQSDLSAHFTAGELLWN